MNIFRMLFGKTSDMDREDEGYTDHMVGQKNGPFYCGTAFCGHATKKAARECWKKHCDRGKEIGDHFYALLDAGKEKEALAFLSAGNQILQPELNPANWPVNRSSAAMQSEYIDRAKAESLNE